MRKSLFFAVAMVAAACSNPPASTTDAGNGTDAGHDAGPSCQDACPSSGTLRCVANGVESCDLQSNGCLGWSMAVACGSNETCENGQCKSMQTCTNACTAGTLQCLGGGVQSCEMQTNGCLGWSAAVSCGTNQTCMNGMCMSTSSCTNECMKPGGLQCAGNTIQQCSTGSNGCLAWSNVSDCGGNGQTCSMGTCVASCQNVCKAGDLQCAGNVLQQCEPGSSGCLEWGTLQTCGSDQTCTMNTCQNKTCNNGCTKAGSLQCAGNSVQQCNADSNGCLNWTQVSTCNSGDTCSQGQCVPACSDACNAGDTQCVGNSIQVCEKNTNGCYGWSMPALCGPGLVCEGTACAPSCTNDCPAQGAIQCSADGTGVQTCLMNPTGCLSWGVAQSCGAGQMCTGTGNSTQCSVATSTQSTIGAACMTDSQCTAGAAPGCIPSTSNWPDGYCTSGCNTTTDCGSTGTCVAGLGFTDNSGNQISVCMETCASNADCRPGYFCGQDGSQLFCYPMCTADSQCGTGGVCNTATGVCSMPASTGYPAAFPAPPQVISYTATPAVLANPTIVPIYFSGDDATITASLNDFYSKIGASTYWSALQEYGVSTASSATPVVLNDAVPTTVNDTLTTGSDVWTLIQNHINDGSLPTPTANTLYVIHYPAGTTIQAGSMLSCQDFGGYHAEADISSNVAYAIIPRCAPPQGWQQIQYLTSAASHELAEASTDPYPYTNPGWYSADAAHYFWTAFGGGTEIGDMCVNDPEAYYQFADLPYVVQRVWSNQNALAGHDPCAPSYPSEVFFNSVPNMSDTINYPAPGGQTVPVTGVSVPAGTTKSIPIDLYSDANTMGAWTVQVYDYYQYVQSLSGQTVQPHLGLVLDNTSGQNGSVLNLSITSMNTAGSTDLFIIVSTLGSGTSATTHVWFGVVGE